MNSETVYAIAILLLLLNAWGIAAMALDKRHAKTGKRRVPEVRLLLIAAAGGAIGVLIGMYALRHKTRHLKFTLGIPAIIAAQLLCVAFAVLRLA